MNVQVSTSEQSNIGTVQNIMGNTRVDNLVDGDAKCVGSVSDEKNNVLYWFVNHVDYDAIIEYNDDGISTPIIVDRNKNVLKFDRGNAITGINVIDNLLFWTDNVNEPKKLNIKTLKLNNHTNLQTHSNMFVNGTSIGEIKEEHITVIRKKPNKAPTITFSETSLQSLILIPNLNFYQSIVGSPVLTSTGENPSITAEGDSPWIEGDVLFLSAVGTSGTLPQNYQAKVEVVSVNQVSIGFQYEMVVIEQPASTSLNVFGDNVTRNFNSFK